MVYEQPSEDDAPHIYEARPDESASEAVIRGVSEVTGASSAPSYSLGETDDSRLDPLYTAIDTDALNALFQGEDTAGAVTFTYSGCRVSVYGDGRISVELLESL